MNSSSIAYVLIWLSGSSNFWANLYNEDILLIEYLLRALIPCLYRLHNYQLFSILLSKIMKLSISNKIIPRENKSDDFFYFSFCLFKGIEHVPKSLIFRTKGISSIVWSNATKIFVGLIFLWNMPLVWSVLSASSNWIAIISLSSSSNSLLFFFWFSRSYFKF